MKNSFKYFIGCGSDIVVVPLCIKLRQINGCVKYFDYSNKYINFLVHDKKLSAKYNEIRHKISILLKKNLIMSQCIMVNTLKLN